MAIFKCTTCGAEFDQISCEGTPVCIPCWVATKPVEGFSYQRYEVGFAAGQEILSSSKPSAAALAIIDRMPERFVTRHWHGGVTVYAYVTESVDGKPYIDKQDRNPLFDELKEAK